MIRLSAFRLSPANQARPLPANAVCLTAASYITPNANIVGLAAQAMPIAEAIRVIAISVPDLTSTACIKLNERMLLLSIFERIAWLTPDNCPVRLNTPDGLQSV
jgi:hypothetical protein